MQAGSLDPLATSLGESTTLTGSNPFGVRRGQISGGGGGVGGGGGGGAGGRGQKCSKNDPPFLCFH